jgi:hypothetical protein
MRHFLLLESDDHYPFLRIRNQVGSKAFHFDIVIRVEDMDFACCKKNVIGL